MTLADYEPSCSTGARAKLPMICANPDVTRVSPEGLVDAPGALARRYQDLGAEVFYHGKPYPAIYDSCLKALAGCSRAASLPSGIPSSTTCSAPRASGSPAPSSPGESMSRTSA
jgi:hypothetical protein